MSQTDRASGLVGNAAFKYPVRAATTANITLSAEQTIDGIACVADDRVLVKNQTTGSENGIWVVSTGSWNRSNDFDGSYDCTTGTMVRCVSGTANANSVWKLDTTGTITIGTTSLTFTAASVGFDAQGMADFIHVATSKATPVDADEFGIWDSVSGLLNKLTLANLKALVSASWNAATATNTTNAGGQIPFPATQNASSDVHTLDDYEEGSWTPSIGGTATYNTQTGRYTKIGKLVTYECFLSIALVGTGSTTTISGLPFTSSNITNLWGTSGWVTWQGAASSLVCLGFVTGANTATLIAQGLSAASTSVGGIAVFANNTTVQFSGFYYVD